MTPQQIREVNEPGPTASGREPETTECPADHSPAPRAGSVMAALNPCSRYRRSPAGHYADQLGSVSPARLGLSFVTHVPGNPQTQMHTARSSLPTSLPMMQSLKRKRQDTEFQSLASQAPITPKECELMVSHRPRAGCPGKAGTRASPPDLPAGSLELKTIPWDYVMDQSIHRTRIRGTYSRWEREGILGISVGTACERGSCLPHASASGGVSVFPWGRYWCLTTHISRTAWSLTTRQLLNC